MQNKRNIRNFGLTVLGIVAFFGSCGQGLYTSKQIDSRSHLSPSQKPTKNDNFPKTFGYDSTCALDDKDPFEIRVRLNKAEYPCLDSTDRRPLIDLTSDVEIAARLGKAKPGSTRVANFLHENTFWIADIVTQEVQSLEFQLSWFTAPVDLPAAHAQMLVKFPEKAMVKLYRQKEVIDHSVDIPLIESRSVAHIILSAEGAAESGKTCELLGGQRGKYAIVYSVASAQQRYREILKRNPKKEVDTFPLNIKNSQLSVEFLNSYLNKSFENFRNLEARIDENDFDVVKDAQTRKETIEFERKALFEKATYRTVGRNCATALVDLFADTSLTTRQTILTNVLGRVAFYPPAAAFFMTAEKLLSLKQKTRLELEQEIQLNH